MKRVSVGVIGFGTIGAGVVKILLKKRGLLKKRSGIDIRLARVCDRDFSRDRGIGKIPRDLQEKDWKRLVSSPDIDIIVELVGGVTIARDIVLSALKNGKIVVTANKALLSEYAREIFSVGIPEVNLFFEAAICGAIPVVKDIQEALIANKIRSLYGIVNGTCNYILSKMFADTLEFDLVLKQAQELGYAEKQPGLDIDGIDSAHKLSLLSLLAFGKYVHPDDIPTEGITNLELIDLLFADEMGYSIKLLAVGNDTRQGLDLRVHPALVPYEHMLSSVEGVFNALYLQTDEAGDMMFYGRGAGRFPTASAVVSDIVDGAKVIASSEGARAKQVIDFSPRLAQVSCRYYVRFTVVDRPGVLAKISGILGRNKISIASVQQTERARAGTNTVPLILITHEALEEKMKKAISEIARLDVVKKEPVVIRIVDL